VKNISLTLFLAILFSQNVYPQFFENNDLYGNIGIAGGNFLGSEAGANLILKEEYFIHVGTIYFQSKASEKPQNYNAGSGILGSGDFDIKDRYNTLNIRGGYVLKMSSKFRAVFNGGLGLQFRDYATDFTVHTPIEGNGGFNFGSSPSHDFIRKNDVSAALIISPRLEYLPSRNYGVFVSPLFIFNKNDNFFGVSVNAIIGKLKNKEDI
jgi:hypothetical protein